MLARIGSMLIKMLVSSILLPNYLGANLFGTYNYPMAFLGFFMGVCTLGTDGLVTRELLRHPKSRDVILGSALRLRLFGGLVALPLIHAAYFMITQVSANQPAASFQQVAIVSLVCIIQSVQIVDSYFQSRAQGKYIMLVQVGGNILSALIKAVLVFAGAPISWFIGSLVLDIILLQVGYIYLYHREGLRIFDWKFDGKIAKYLLAKGWPLALSSIFVSLYMKIDQVMIDAMLGAKEFGIYSTVVQFSESWYFIPVAISTALFPAIMNYRKKDPMLYKKRMNNLYELLVVASVCIAVGITVVSPWVYQWFYGARRPEFLPGSEVLQVHIWSGVFAFIATGSSQYLIAEGLTKVAMTRTMLGAITNILLNVWWIPRFGIVGAAYSTIVAYMMAALSILFFTKTRAHGVELLKSLFLFHTLSAIFRKMRK